MPDPPGADTWGRVESDEKRTWQPVEVLQYRPGPPPVETPEDDA